MTTSTRRATRLVLLAAAAVLSACPAASTPDAGCTSAQRVLADGRCVPDRACGQGFVPDPTGAGCLEVRAEACDAGTMPMLGSTTCAPVGWTSCPQGFAPHASGWGCAPVLPEGPCDAGMVARLGSTSCVPLGDCAAPFPPSNATLFVDPTFSTTDATHFTSLADAVIVAPPGSVVAVEAGQYPLTADLSVGKQLTLVGRCAEKVVVSRASPNIISLVVPRFGNLTLSGMSFVDLDAAPVVQSGGKALLEDVDVRHSRWLGVLVNGAGSTLTLRRSRVADTQPTPTGANGWGLVVEAGGAATLEDVVIEHNQGNNVVARDDATTLKLTRTIVRDGIPAPQAGVGVGLTAAFGAYVEAHQCAFSHNTLRHVSAGGGGSTVLVAECALDGALHATTSSGQEWMPTALAAQDGSRVTIVHSAFSGSASEVSVVGQGSTITMTDSVVRDSPADTFSAVWLSDGASLTMDRVAIVSTVSLGLDVIGADAVVKHTLIANTRLDQDGLYGVGAQVSYGGTLTLDSSALVGNTAVGLIVSDTTDAGVPTHAMVTSTLIADTKTGQGGVAGLGLNLHSGARLELTGCAFTGNHESALSVAGGVATVTDSVFRGTLPNGLGDFGHGLIGVPSTSADGAPSTLWLTNVTVTSNASVGLMAAGMAGAVTGSTFERNQTAVHVQDGTTLEQADAVPTTLAPGQLVISSDTVFFGNTTLTGTGTVPLPKGLGSVSGP